VSTARSCREAVAQGGFEAVDVDGRRRCIRLGAVAAPFSWLTAVVPAVRALPGLAERFKTVALGIDGLQVRVIALCGVCGQHKETAQQDGHSVPVPCAALPGHGCGAGSGMRSRKTRCHVKYLRLSQSTVALVHRAG